MGKLTISIAMFNGNVSPPRVRHRWRWSCWAPCPRCVWPRTPSVAPVCWRPAARRWHGKWRWRLVLPRNGPMLGDHVANLVRVIGEILGWGWGWGCLYIYIYICVYMISYNVNLEVIHPFKKAIGHSCLIGEYLGSTIQVSDHGYLGAHPKQQATISWSRVYIMRIGMMVVIWDHDDYSAL